MFGDSLDPSESKVYCVECSGYLYSVSVYDGLPNTVKCPFVKDPSGGCTGVYPRRVGIKGAGNV